MVRLHDSFTAARRSLLVRKGEVGSLACLMYADPLGDDFMLLFHGIIVFRLHQRNRHSDFYCGSRGSLCLPEEYGDKSGAGVCFRYRFQTAFGITMGRINFFKNSDSKTKGRKFL